MKFYLSLFFICCMVMIGQAVTPQRVMIINSGEEDEKKIEVTSGTRITFSKERQEMIVGSDISDSDTTFSLSEINGIVFTIESFSTVKDQLIDNLFISYSDGILSITNDNPTQPIHYSVWSASGMRINEGEAFQEAILNLKGLEEGIYLVKANNKSLKFIKH